MTNRSLLIVGALMLMVWPISAQNGGASPWVTPAINAVRVQQAIFYSPAAGSEVSYHIYLPEAYEVQPERRFPVLYWLHGSGGGLKGIPHLARYFDAAIQAGVMPPVLIVFPNGHEFSMWVDSKNGHVPMETVVIEELIPHIDATYRTIAAPQGRLIEGFSMGGYGAARLGFKYPYLFAAISILGAGPMQQEFIPGQTPRVRPPDAQWLLDTVYGGDQDYFKSQSPWALAEQNTIALQSRVIIRQAIGQRDNTLENNRRFHEHLVELAIPHTFKVLPGVGHDTMAVLNTLGEANWAFYNAVFAQANLTSRKYTQCIPSGPGRLAYLCWR